MQSALSGRKYATSWSPRRLGLGSFAIVFGAWLLPSQIGHADSLTSAMASAYENNPTLNAARAGLRARDEGLPQAKSAYRPQVTASGDYGVTRTDVDPARRFAHRRKPRIRPACR